MNRPAYRLTPAEQVRADVILAFLPGPTDALSLADQVRAFYARRADSGRMTQAQAEAHVDYSLQVLGDVGAVLLEAELRGAAS